jgi:tetratricopeptide (TPR) repeat protein
MMVMRRALLTTLPVIAALWSGLATAGAIADQVQRHVDEAVSGGVAPADFHHLFMAFSWRATLPNWTAVDTNLDRLAGVRRIDPLMVDELRLIRARIEIDRGLSTAAKELFRTMGGLEAWWIAGPETLEELADFDHLAIPPPRDTVWRWVPGTDPLGWVRLSGLAWPPQRQMAYLATTVMSDREQPVAIRVGAAQVARAWLNGREVLTTQQPLRRGEDQAAGGGWLRQGRNTLIVAVASEDSEWWLRARLTRPSGEQLEGVREIQESPTAVAALDRKAPNVRDLETEIRAAIAAGTTGARTSLAAYLVARHPQPVGGGGVQAACTAARAESPGEARLLEWIGTTEPGLSRELLADAIAAEPDLVWARLELAGWLGQRGLFAEAYGVLADWMAGDPAVGAASLELDGVSWGPLVLPELAELARAYPRCLKVNLALGETAMANRRWDLAEEAVQRLAALAPEVPQVSDLRQRLAENCGNGELLRALVSDLVFSDPNQPDVRVRLARLLAADDDLEGARLVLAVGLERSPTNVDLMLEAARLENDGGDPQRAIELARSVLQYRPQDRQAQRLLELLGEASENLEWLRSEGELWEMAADAPAGQPAVALLDHREIRFLPSNLTEERVQQAILITSADRARDFLVQTLPFVAETERLRILHARILRRDGSEIAARQGDSPRLSEPEFNLYYDTRLRVLSFSEFADGDLIEIAYVLAETEEANETGPYNGGLVPLGRAIPVALMEVELSGSESSIPDWELVDLEGEPKIEKLPGGDVALRWVWRDLPAVPRDVPPAPPLLVSPYLVYSNHPEWGGLADWYGRHVAPRVRVSEQVEETARRLVEGTDDRLDRINRIYRFVTNEIRYVGLEFGEHRYRPFSADWVLHHKIGDCKDKAALLVALLDAIDIPARMVMVRTSDLGPVGNRLAVLEIFNHAIAYLPEDDLWLDGTAAGHVMYPPPSMDQDAVVLVVEGASSRLQTTPAVGAGLSSLHYRVLAAGPENVEIEVRSEDTGDAADMRRAQFGGSREPQRFARWLRGQFPGVQVVGEPSEQIVSSRDPTIIDVKGSIARSALQSSGGVRVYPGEIEWKASAIPGGTRYGPLMVDVKPDLEWTLEVELGRPPRNLPESSDLATPFGDLRLEIDGNDSGYRVKGWLHLTPGLVAADNVDELRDFLVTVERRLGRNLESP